MKMAKRSLFFAMVLSIGIGDLAIAQQQPGRQTAREAARERNENLVTQVFQIKNINLEEAYEAAQSVYNLSHIAPVHGNNTLVIRDTPERLAQLADLFAQMEEYEPVSAKYAAEAVVLSLDHREAVDIASLLNPIFSGARIVADYGSQQLLVTANTAQIAEIMRMVQSLDRPERAELRGLPAKTLSVTVDFIRATIGAKGAGELPENLQGVNAVLRKNGLGDAKIYGHLMVRTQEKQHFESNGVVGSGKDESALSVLRIQGNAEMIDGQAQLRIESSLRVPFTRTRQDSEGKTRTTVNYRDFSLSTTTTVPLGDYLVLGAMPASTGNSDTILMVIHITAD